MVFISAIFFIHILLILRIITQIIFTTKKYKPCNTIQRSALNRHRVRNYFEIAPPTYSTSLNCKKVRKYASYRQYYQQKKNTDDSISDFSISLHFFSIVYLFFFFFFSKLYIIIHITRSLIFINVLQNTNNIILLLIK